MVVTRRPRGDCIKRESGSTLPNQVCYSSKKKDFNIKDVKCLFKDSDVDLLHRCNEKILLKITFLDLPVNKPANSKTVNFKPSKTEGAYWFSIDLRRSIKQFQLD